MHKLQVKIRSINRKNIHKYLLVMAICGACALLGILLSQNEVYQDDWYIEASIDGFFGEDNRSLWVLGPNYVITAIIYLLSLTGVRLFWLHILLVVMNFVSHILITSVLINNLGKYTGAILASLYGLLMALLVSFEFQFTTTAAYVIASGCVYMFDALSHDNKRGALVFSAIWIILGTSLRFDCIYYAVAFMGLLWLFQVVTFIKKNKMGLKCKRLWRFVVRRLIPFLITLLISFGLEVSQKMLMNWHNPGFTEWNSTRTLVDDYAIPEYWANEKAYKEIGISYNDYQLLQSWNNLDLEFFTQEKYEQILQIGQQNQLDESTGKSGLTVCFSVIASTIKEATENVAFWFAVIVLAIIYAFIGRSVFGMVLALFGGALAFSAYFWSIGRLIWRTEWPIWIAFFAAIVVLLCDNKYAFSYKTLKRPKVVLLIASCLVLFIPFSNSDSLYSKYVSRYNNPNNVGRYISSLLTKSETSYVTYNRGVADYMASNKELFYFPLWSNDWLQQYPLYVKDTFRFQDIGAGANWGTLGQYMINLEPIQKNFENYGIENPFRDLVNDNVRIAARVNEHLSRTKELYIYLKEHYYPTVAYSVEEVCGDVIIGRFIDAFDTTNHIETNGDIRISFGYGSSFSGVSKLVIESINIELFEENADEAYIRLEDRAGRQYTFALLKGDSSQALIYDDMLILGEEYSVDFIFQHENNWYISEKCTTLKIPTVLEDFSVIKLDLLSKVYNNPEAVTGYYSWEEGKVWTRKYSNVRLYDKDINNQGLLLDLYVPDFDLGTTNYDDFSRISIYVNGDCVYEFAPISGEYCIFIEPDMIRNENGRYLVEIVCPYVFTPILDRGTADGRELSVCVSYIGSAGKYPE